MLSAVRPPGHSFVPACALAVIVTIALSPLPSRAEISSSIGGGTVPAVTSLAGDSVCGGGIAIAGGIDSDNVSVVELIDQVPHLPNSVALVDADPGSYATQFGFRTSISNGAQVAHDYRTGVICSSLPATTIAGDPLTIPASGSIADRVLCPPDSFATGGGIDVEGLTFTSSDGPVLDDGSANGLLLILAPDGPGAAPIGWRASARNLDTQTAYAARVGTICVPVAVTTEIGSQAVPAGGSESKRALCPAGRVAYGGGVDVNDVAHMTVTASAPVFDDGSPDGQRLISRANGLDVAPIGWFAAVRNDDNADHMLKVAAICPEPSEEALGLAVFSTLFVRWRTRRERS